MRSRPGNLATHGCPGVCPPRTLLMEWLRTLHGTIVGLDTAPLIYFIERHPTYLPLLLPFFEAVERGDIQVVTSTLTLTEVLVHPYRDGNPDLAERYFHMLLRARHLRMVALSPAIAAEAARVRADFQNEDARRHSTRHRQ